MQTRCNRISDLAAALLLLCTGGGVGGYGVWHHASGMIAERDAVLVLWTLFYGGLGATEILGNKCS